MAGPQPSYKLGDLVALHGLRVIAIHGGEALLHYERPTDLARALRHADIPEALRLSPHFWVRLGDVVALTG